MAWASHQSEKTAWTLEQLKARDLRWMSSPISERERWEKDLGQCYDLDGEYEVNDDLTVLRWKFNGTDEQMLEWQSPLYQTIVLSKKMRPYKPFDTTFGDKK